MLFILVATEGDVSEPKCIEAIHTYLRGQVPLTGTFYIEMIPVPLGGNQGHRKLIEKANAAIEELSKDRESLLHYSAEDPDDSVVIEKWLICDHDKMNLRGVEPAELYTAASDAGYQLIINKPNFEFFILTLLRGEKLAAKVSPANFEQAINQEIDKLNKSNIKNKGFTDSMLVPTYSKHKFAAERFFGTLLQYNPHLLDNLRTQSADNNPEMHYTDMPQIVNRFRELYND